MSAPARPEKANKPEKAEKKPTNYKAAWAETRKLMWQHRRALSIGLVLMLVNRLAGLVLPGSVKWIIDEVMTNKRLELLAPIAIAAGIATLLQAGTSFALSQVISVAAQRAITDLRRRVQARVLRLPISFFDSTQSGVLINRVMNDAEGIRNLIGTGIVQLVGGTLTATLALAYLFYLNWFLTTITLAFLAVFGAVMAYAFVKLRPIFRERSKIQAEVSGRLGQAMGGARVVKVYTAEKREEIVFTRGAHRLFRNIASTITGTSAIGAISTVIIGAVGILILGVGGRAVVAGTMTLGDLVSYIFFVGLVSFPVVQMASIGTQVTEAFAGLDRIREIFETPTEDEDDQQRNKLAREKWDVVFEDVWFEYRPNVPVLRGISFTAPSGTTTALVGSSGSGKSTLISLILAFNRPQRGRVTIGGQDLATLRLRDYRSTLGVVLQDNFLFDGTVAENIAFSKPGASMEQVKAAARVANCDEFVSEFPSDYRRRYAQYRSDPDSKVMHAALPLIAIWDDHELANNSWVAGAQEHDPSTEGAFNARRDAAIQAWHEWLPVRSPNPANLRSINRSFDFGGLLALHLLETRLLARDRPLEVQELVNPATAAAARATLASATRTMMGREQLQWLQGRMAASRATWEVLGQPVLMARMTFPVSVLQHLNPANTSPEAVAAGQRAVTEYLTALATQAQAPASLTPAQRALLDPVQNPQLGYNLDAWDGYPVEREMLLGMARQLNKRLVVLAGDTHNAWASRLTLMDGTVVGNEFATQSISSPGLEEYLIGLTPVQTQQIFRGVVGDLRFADTGRRGFLLMEFTPQHARGTWHFVSSVKTRTYTLDTSQSLSVSA